MQRFYCKPCASHFSVATLSLNYHQKKRQNNHNVARLLVAGVSLRECARVLKLNKKRSKVSVLEFDDLESFEQTKCKPLSITLAVEHKTRWILGYEVSQMPAKGLLSKLSVKKYGKRDDKRTEGRHQLFERIQKYVLQGAIIKSDQNPHYVNSVKTYFPQSKHISYKGRDGCIVGQGELKKQGFDPLFSLNHSCAMMRYRISRLIRRTWNTTKKALRLSLHLALMCLHHNLNLKNISFSTI